MTSEPLLDLHYITKSYRRDKVLRLENFTLQEGDRLLVRGPNGCGKSTFLRILAGLTEPDQGRIAWNSRNPLSIVYLPQAMMGFADLSVYFNELLLGLVMGSRHRPEVAATKSMIYFQARSHVPLGALSGGYRRLFSLKQACSAGTDIFILDEPLSQLDDQRVSESIALLREISSTAKVVVASQPSNKTIQHEFESLWNKHLSLDAD